jgi:succinyl-diaminopimelate desuccinylase
MGENAIHSATAVLARLAEYEPHTVRVDGLDYREGLNAVGISGGVAGNVIPDRCDITVNYRFAPDKTVGEAVAVVDQAGGARPGVDSELAHGFVSALGVEVRPKYGWTDVARFGEWGIPAVNFGPGDPSLAHSDDERVAVADIQAVYAGMKNWLIGDA